LNIIIINKELTKNLMDSNPDIIINSNFFSRYGYNVYLVTLKGKRLDNVQFKHLIVNNKCKICNNNYFLILYNFFIFLEFNKIIKKLSPNIIICAGASSLYFSFIIGIINARLLKIPVILEWRGSDLLLKNNIIRTLIKKILLYYSNTNIVQSKKMHDTATKINNKSKIITIPSKGVDTKFFIIKKYNPNSYTRLLYVGRLHPIKGLSFLIEAFSIILENQKNIKLIIVGDGVIKDNLINMCKNKNISKYVDFVGNVNHESLIKYYHEADIFVLPSISEGLSNVIMEAMSCGLPVVATNIGGNKELVINNKGGYIVKSKNILDLKDALNRLINNPKIRETMGRFNRKFIKQYDQEIILNKKIELIEKILYNKY